MLPVRSSVSARFRSLAAITAITIMLLVGVPVGSAHAAPATTRSLSGTVTLGAAATPAGAGAVSVSLYVEESGSIRGPLQSTILTDASGHYSFADMSPGLYTVLFHVVATGTYVDQWWPSNRAENVATRITILNSPVVADTNILPAGTLSGTVTDTSGHALGQVGVWATAQERPSGDPALTGQTDATLVYTDAGGHYLFAQLTPGTYRLRFYKTQNPGTGVLNGNWTPDGSYASTPAEVNVPAGAAHAGVDMALPFGAANSGSVHCTSCASGFIPSWEMTASYELKTSAAGQAETWQTIQTVGVLADGDISVTGLWPGRYRIKLHEVGSAHYSETTSAPFDLVGGSTANVSVSTAADDPVTAPWAGMLIKSATSPTLYFDNGPGELIPVSSFATLADLGIPPVYTVVPASVISASVIAPPLSNALDCGSGTFFGGGGKLWAIDPVLFAGLAVTDMDEGACADLPHTSNLNIRGAMFVHSAEGAVPVYVVDGDGMKHPILAPGLFDARAAMVTFAYDVGSGVIIASPHFLDTLPTGPAVFGAGTLVKSSASPTLYLSDGLNGLIPVASLSTVADFGISLNYLTVAPSVIASRTIASAPLTNTVVCNGQTQIGGSHAIWSIQPALVAGLPRTILDPRTCNAMLSGGTQFIVNALFVKSLTNPVIYHVSPAGYKEAVLDWATLVSLAGNTAPLWLTESDTFLASVPTAPDLVTPGMLVKTASSSTVYLVDGASRLLPIRSFESVSAMGLSTSYVTVSNTLISSRTIGGTLGSVVSCGGTTYLAGDGQLWPTTTDLTASYSNTTLDASTCVKLPHATQALTHALFVKSASSPTIYYLDPSGKKRALLQMASMDALSAPDAATWHTIDGSFLGSIPNGPDLVAAGMLVKSASSPTVYLVDGANRLVPIRTFESVSAMGLSTVFSTVSDATLSGRSVATAALGIFVNCGTTTSIAGDGKLWPITAPLAANYTATTLDASTCAVIPASGQSLTRALFVKSASSPTIYYLDPSGKKRALLEMASMTSLSAPDAATWLTVDSTFLANIPSGSDLVSAGMLIKSASNPTLYIVDGAGGIIPIRTFASLSDFGLSMNYFTVSNQTISGLAIPHDALGDTVLGDVVTCGADTNTTWIASAGQLWQTQVPIHLLAGMTALSTPLCNSLIKSSTILNPPVIIKAPSGPTLYLLDSSGKHVIPNGESLARILHGSPLVYENVNSTFVADLPYGSPEQ